jgi:23S rRNA (cytidine1920-2'-O)/16S rRNA (cytidine1409-2'-O)-methyltransferase
VRVAHVAAELGWPPQGVARSRLPGPSGNVEFFLWLRRDSSAEMSDEEIMAIVTGEEGHG